MPGIECERKDGGFSHRPKSQWITKSTTTMTTTTMTTTTCALHKYSRDGMVERRFRWWSEDSTEFGVEKSTRHPELSPPSEDKRRAAANGDEARVFELQATPAVVQCVLGGWELDYIDPDLYSRRSAHLERFRHPGRAVGSLDERFRAEDSFDLGLRSGPTRVARAHSRPTTRSWTPSGAPIRSAEPGRSKRCIRPCPAVGWPPRF